METAATISMVTTLYLLVFGLAELLYKNGLPPFITRKIVHIGSGIISAFLPLFVSLKTAILLGIVFFVLVLISKRRKILQSVHAIEGSSVGAILFAPSIILTALIFWPIDIRIYQGACLILGLSDGIAGLIGQRYGKKSYTITGPKTIEGSAVFFGITLLLLLVFVYATNGALETHDIIKAFGGAMFVTATEALCGNGWDNLFVPLASGAILYTIL